ncbi:hypothetical protein CO018_01185, partial [Candidatus Beckwithbacteria bacterium CG_4_9_14_0_2_um_filter_47_11]
MKPIQAIKFVTTKALQSAKFYFIIYCLLIFFVSFSTLINMFIFKGIIDGSIYLIFVWFVYEITTKLLTRYGEYLWNLIDLKLTIFNTADFVDKLETLDLANFENPKTFDKIWRSFNRIPWQIRAYLYSAIQFTSQLIVLS